MPTLECAHETDEQNGTYSQQIVTVPPICTKHSDTCTEVNNSEEKNIEVSTSSTLIEGEGAKFLVGNGNESDATSLEETTQTSVPDTLNGSNSEQNSQKRSGEFTTDSDSAAVIASFTEHICKRDREISIRDREMKALKNEVECLKERLIEATQKYDTLEAEKESLEKKFDNYKKKAEQREKEKDEELQMKKKSLKNTSNNWHS